MVGDLRRLPYLPPPTPIPTWLFYYRFQLPYLLFPSHYLLLRSFGWIFSFFVLFCYIFPATIFCLYLLRSLTRYIRSLPLPLAGDRRTTSPLGVYYPAFITLSTASLPATTVWFGSSGAAPADCLLPRLPHHGSFCARFSAATWLGISIPCYRAVYRSPAHLRSTTACTSVLPCRFHLPPPYPTLLVLLTVREGDFRRFGRLHNYTHRLTEHLHYSPFFTTRTTGLLRFLYVADRTCYTTAVLRWLRSTLPTFVGSLRTTLRFYAFYVSPFGSLPGPSALRRKFYVRYLYRRAVPTTFWTAQYCHALPASPFYSLCVYSRLTGLADTALAGLLWFTPTTACAVLRRFLRACRSTDLRTPVTVLPGCACLHTTHRFTTTG